WYMGPMFRHERPQKGRYRQFHQLGIEVFGVSGPAIEAELILVSARLWQLLGVSDRVTLEINTLGTSDDRVRYRQMLVNYLTEHKDQLDEDSLRRLETNPLRVLDSKNPSMQTLLEQAPSLLDVLSEESLAHFEQLKSLLKAAGIAYRINPRLVRGLDYYSHTVFEWVSSALGAQGTVCAGGRYDGLIEQLGGRPNAGAGWAAGMERLLALIEDVHGVVAARAPHAYLVMGGDEAMVAGLSLAESLRTQIPQLRLRVDCAGGSLKSQFKRADKSGAEWAMVIGEAELESDSVGLKHLRESGGQENLDREALSAHFEKICNR
ncbi:MAG: histidine--tRNA ligase, partial [Pseudomonadota bacterium]